MVDGYLTAILNKNPLKLWFQRVLFVLVAGTGLEPVTFGL